MRLHVIEKSLQIFVFSPFFGYMKIRLEVGVITGIWNFCRLFTTLYCKEGICFDDGNPDLNFPCIDDYIWAKNRKSLPGLELNENVSIGFTRVTRF